MGVVMMAGILERESKKRISRKTAKLLENGDIQAIILKCPLTNGLVSLL